MEERTRVALVVAATVALFLAVQLTALALAPDFQQRGMQATEDPGDPTTPLLYVGAMLVATAVMLGAMRLGAHQVIRGFVVLTGGVLSWYVLGVLFGKALAGVVGPGAVGWLALGAAAVIALGLVVHPEWYVIDVAGVLMGAGAAGLFGISFGVLPALVLLVVLAVYDAVSVYGTEHMLTLAEGVMEMRVPVVLVVPATTSFSMLDGGPNAAEGPGDADGQAKERDEATDDDAGAGAPEQEVTSRDDAERPGIDVEGGPLQRDALFVGLGDAVMPAVLVASSAHFLRGQAPPLLPGFALNVPALGAMAGSIAGLLVLLRFVIRGRPHAGLPLLNGGAILGYLVGATAAGVPLVRALGL